MLAVAGDSASGKTTLTRGVAELMGAAEVTAICTDDYHKYDRQTRRNLNLTALHPACNYLDIVGQHLQLLRQGQPILKPTYNHSGGTIESPEYVEPGQLVVVEGLLAISTVALQKCFDLTIYLDPPEELRRAWKVRRDTTQRGYTAAEVLDSIDRRLTDSQTYVWPQQKVADLVIRFYPPAENSRPDNTHLGVRIMQRHTLPSPDLSDLLAQNNEPGLRLQKDTWGENGPIDILEIDGAISASKARQLEELLWSHLQLPTRLSLDKIGGYLDGYDKRHSNSLALTQLLITYYLLTIR
jgi:phosphoribulokinase